MKAIPVEDAYKVYGTASASIPEDAPLKEVVERFGCEPGLRGIFLVDSSQQFVGMITRADLLKYVRVRIIGGGGTRAVSGKEIARFVLATNAKHIARGDRRSLGVKPSDTLQTALDQMITWEEDILPVLDSEGKILGDLRLSELLLKALEVWREEMR